MFIFRNGIKMPAEVPYLALIFCEDTLTKIDSSSLSCRSENGTSGQMVLEEWCPVDIPGTTVLTRYSLSRENRGRHWVEYDYSAPT